MSDVPTSRRGALGERVRVVTDSTAGLPEPLLRGHGITVVPLQLTIGAGTPEERSGRDDGGLDAAVLDALRAHAPVQTSQPPPTAFSAAWGEHGEVVAVHLSSQLSGTLQAAKLAAAHGSGCAVEVVDGATTGMGLGFVALVAARVAAAGGTLAEVAAAAREATQQTDSLFLLDSVETLQRGGRLAGASARLDSALSVRPLLHVVGGALVPLERVRTSARGLQRLEELAVDRTEGGRAEIAVMHAGAADRAETLARRLDERLGVHLEELVVEPVSAVVAAHVGVGCVGVAVHRL